MFGKLTLSPELEVVCFRCFHRNKYLHSTKCSVQIVVPDSEAVSWRSCFMLTTSSLSKQTKDNLGWDLHNFHVTARMSLSRKAGQWFFQTQWLGPRIWRMTFCSRAARLDPIKTRKMYANSEEMFLNSQFCNFSEEEEASMMELYGWCQTLWYIIISNHQLFHHILIT